MNNRRGEQVKIVHSLRNRTQYLKKKIKKKIKTIISINDMEVTNVYIGNLANKFEINVSAAIMKYIIQVSFENQNQDN